MAHRLPDDLGRGKRLFTPERTASGAQSPEDMRKRIVDLERDLHDALSFAAVPIRRCPSCERIALSSGYVCSYCGADPSYPTEGAVEGKR